MLQKLCQEGSQGPPLEFQNRMIFEVGGAIWRSDGVPRLLDAKSGPKIAPGPQNYQELSKNNEHRSKIVAKNVKIRKKSIKIKSELSLPARSSQNR